MFSKHFLCLLALLALNQLVQASSKNCFRAAVYEHVQIKEPADDPLAILNNNLDVYSNVLRIGHYENVNMIVFPEDGLVPGYNKETVLSAGLAAIAPDVGTNPCKLHKKQRRNITHSSLDDDAKDDLLNELDKETEELADGVLANKAVLRKISCLAKKYKTHVTVDLSELEVTDKPAEESTTTVQPTTAGETTQAQSESDRPATTTAAAIAPAEEAQTQTVADSTTPSDNIDEQTDSTGQTESTGQPDSTDRPTEGTSTDSTTTGPVIAETTTTGGEERATTQAATTTGESATTQAATTGESATTQAATEAASTTEAPTTTTAETTTASPQKVYSLYNTAFVFDDKGKLVAKYRKTHLFGESQTYTRPENQKPVTFENKYGKFGLAICADLLFEHPVKDLVEQEKIDHLIFPTSWFDSLPALAAVNYHSAAAIKYGVNILAANRRNLSIGAYGSGIYTGDGVKVQTPFSEERLLIAELPIGVSKRKKAKLEDWECKHTDKIHIKAKLYGDGLGDALEDNKAIGDYKQKFAIPFDSLQTKQLKGKQGSIKDLCEGDVCCDVEWKKKTSSKSDDFYLAVSNQVRTSQDPESNWYEEACLLFNYDTDEKEYKLSSSTRFTKLQLKGRFNTTDVFPNVISSKLAVTPTRYWTFKQSNGEAQIDLKKSNKPVNFVTLYARNFAKDPVSS